MHGDGHHRLPLRPFLLPRGFGAFRQRQPGKQLNALLRLHLLQPIHGKIGEVERAVRAVDAHLPDLPLLHAQEHKRIRQRLRGTMVHRAIERNARNARDARNTRPAFPRLHSATPAAIAFLPVHAVHRIKAAQRALLAGGGNSVADPERPGLFLRQAVHRRAQTAGCLKLLQPGVRDPGLCRRAIRRP